MLPSCLSRQMRGACLPDRQVCRRVI